MILNEILNGGIPANLKNKIGNDYIWAFYWAAHTRRDLDPSIIEQMDERLLESSLEQEQIIKELTSKIHNSESKPNQQEEQEQIII